MKKNMFTVLKTNLWTERNFNAFEKMDYFFYASPCKYRLSALHLLWFYLIITWIHLDFKILSLFYLKFLLCYFKTMPCYIILTITYSQSLELPNNKFRKSSGVLAPITEYFWWLLSGFSKVILKNFQPALKLIVKIKLPQLQ